MPHNPASMTLTLNIPDEALAGLAVPRPEVPGRLRLEMACALYQQELLSFGKCATLAGVHPFVLGHELTRRGIARHYDGPELENDAAYVAECLDRQ